MTDREAATSKPTRWHPGAPALVALVALVALATLLAFRASVLTAVGGILVHEDPVVEAPRVLVLRERLAHLVPRGRLLDHAVTQGDRKVLVLQERPSRLTRLGVVQASGEVLGDELLRAGMPAGSFELIPYGHTPVAYSLETLGGWLDRHPEEEIFLLCHRLATRTCRVLADRLLTPEAAERISVTTLGLGELNEANWWKSRAGLRGFSKYLAHWVHASFIGADPIPGNSPSPREHVRGLLGEER